MKPLYYGAKATLKSIPLGTWLGWAMFLCGVLVMLWCVLSPQQEEAFVYTIGIMMVWFSRYSEDYLNTFK